MTLLCDLAYKYGSDKCPKIKHDYTPYYYELFKDIRSSILKVLEIGVGEGSQPGMKHVPKHYQVGASLRMWRDFFPNAQIYGIDIDPKCIFEEERIKTFYRSQSRVWDLAKTLEVTGTDIDLVIDDGSHNISDQIFSCEYLMPYLKKEVIYIIEDAHESRELMKRLSYVSECMQFKRTRRAYDNRLVMVKNIKK